jgi:cob(I)alamin adenosyltransferase
MKIYTKGGDHGETSLLTGSRVLKSNPNVAAYGDLDELNSFVGLLISQLPNSSIEEIKTLKLIQNELFVIGTYLAIDDMSKIKFELPKFNKDITSQLEKSIDTYQLQLTPLKNFILPGGSLNASYCHICRSITRRVERHIVELLHQNKTVKEEILVFINRLSDYFFVLARFLNKVEKREDEIWSKL